MEEVLTTTQDTRGNGGFQNHEGGGGPDWNRVEVSAKTWWRPVPMSPYPPTRACMGKLMGFKMEVKEQRQRNLAPD